MDPPSRDHGNRPRCTTYIWGYEDWIVTGDSRYLTCRSDETGDDDGDEDSDDKSDGDTENKIQDRAQDADTFTTPPDAPLPDPSSSSDVPPATTPPEAEQNNLATVSKQRTRADGYTPSKHLEPALLADRPARHQNSNTHCEGEMVKENAERQKHAAGNEHDAQEGQTGLKQDVDRQQPQTEQAEQIGNEVQELGDPDLASSERISWFMNLLANVGKSEAPEIGGRERKPKPDAGGK